MAIRTHKMARRLGDTAIATFDGHSATKRSNSVGPCVGFLIPFFEGSGSNVKDVISGAKYAPLALTWTDPYAPTVGNIANMVPSALAVVLSGDGTTSTVTETGHGRSVGQSVLVAGATDTNYNGTVTVASVVDEDTWTYASTGSGADSGTAQAIALTTIASTSAIVAFVIGDTAASNAGLNFRFGNTSTNSLIRVCPGAAVQLRVGANNWNYTGYAAEPVTDTYGLTALVAQPESGGNRLMSIYRSTTSANDSSVAAWNSTDTTPIIPSPALTGDATFENNVTLNINTAPTSTAMFGVLVFADGVPTDLEEGLAWMRTDAIAGNKRVYPKWVSLL